MRHFKKVCQFGTVHKFCECYPFCKGTKATDKIRCPTPKKCDPKKTRASKK